MLLIQLQSIYPQKYYRLISFKQIILILTNKKSKKSMLLGNEICIKIAAIKSTTNEIIIKIY